MSSAKQISLIVKNTLFLLIGKISAGVLSILLIATIARQLGVEQFGLYTLSLTIGGIFAVIVDFGFRYLTTYEISRDKTEFGKYLANGIIAKFIIGIPCLFILFLLLRIFYPLYVNYVVLIACIAIFFRSFMEFMFAFFDGFEKMYYTASLSFIYTLLIFIVTTVLIYFKYLKVSQLFSGQIVVGIIVLLLTLWILNRSFSPNISGFDFNFMLVFFKKSIPFGLFFTFGIIYNSLDTIFLSIMKDTTVVGYYQSAIRFIAVLEIIPLLLSNALYPTLSKNIINSKDEASLILESVMRYTIYLAIPLAIGTGLLSKQIITILYGSNYTKAILILQIFIFALPIRYCGYILGISLFATNTQNFRTISGALACFVNIILNIILIPRYSYIGAALTAIFTTTILTALYYIFLSKKFYRVKIEKFILSPLISGFIMALIILLLEGYKVIITIPIAIVSYFISLTLLRGIKREDFTMVKGIFLKGDNI